jgi:CHAD domain-containing protein
MNRPSSTSVPPTEVASLERIYRLDPRRGADVSAALSKRAGAAPHVLRPRRRTFYDTFDWRVFRSDGALQAVGDAPCDLQWYDRNGSRRHRARVRRVPAFASDLPPGPFKEELRRVTEVRRLLPVVDLVDHKREWLVRDAQERPLAQMTLTAATATAPPGGEEHQVPVTLRVRPEPGREKATDRFLRVVERELGIEPSEQMDLEAALEAIGRKPDDYSTKLRLSLDGDMRADEAMHVILRFLCGTIVRNEVGVRENLDPEFLHDFRVACRRTRAALSEVKAVLPDETASRFRRDFQALARVTGPVRDLDVYLIELPRYREQLPPDVRAGLDPLRRFLIEQQRKEHGTLVRTLDSGWYRSMISDWRDYVLTLPAAKDGGRRAGKPISLVARKRLRRAHERVVESGTSLTPRSPASDLHRLRIDCKKLRYLLEFFRSLYEEAAVDRVVEDLKGFQDTLGLVNDLEVQRHGLRRFGLEMSGTGEAPPETLIAIGQLIEHLREQQQTAREHFTEDFRRFSRPRARRRFDRLTQSA